MTDVIEAVEEIRQNFRRCKENQLIDLISIFNNVRSCTCGHKSRIQLIQDKMLWFQRMTRVYKIVLGVLSLVLMLITYGFWLARNYNHATIFGSDCSGSFFLPFGGCPVAF